MKANSSESASDGCNGVCNEWGENVTNNGLLVSCSRIVEMASWRKMSSHWVQPFWFAPLQVGAGSYLLKGGQIVLEHVQVVVVEKFIREGVIAQPEVRSERRVSSVRPRFNRKALETQGAVKATSIRKM